MGTYARRRTRRNKLLSQAYGWLFGKRENRENSGMRTAEGTAFDTGESTLRRVFDYTRELNRELTIGLLRSRF
ncbi:hypothetical protein [Saccharibacillus qingshengii]|uniref:hypothetical protein n=1 Tax=Saccharibacillus qingshengii TaxID=1763540 RepID=UPI0015517517|nr:hypothetical protein [Saccharibacillus qingshengii]